MPKSLYYISVFVLIIFAAGQSCSRLIDDSALEPDEFIASIYEKPGKIIDVRSVQRYNTEHLPQASNLDIEDTASFKQQIASLTRKEVYYLYCQDGKLSRRALVMMKEAGFPEVYELKGGLKSLSKEGYQLSSL